MNLSKYSTITLAALKEAATEFASNAWFCKTITPRDRMTAKMRAALQAAHGAAHGAALTDQQSLTHDSLGVQKAYD